MQNNLKENTYIPTLNNKGYVTKIVDEYCHDFFERCSTSKKPIVDLGVGFGFTTREILKKDCQVFANDIDSAHLEKLQDSCTEDEKSRLTLFSGPLPDVYSFENESIGGVLASRCFHFLTGDEITYLVKEIYKSLCKGGFLCIVAETPYLGHLEKFSKVYEDKKAKGYSWPGFVSDMKKYTDRPHSSEWVNLLDPEILERVLKDTGFLIKKSGFVDRRAYFPKEVLLDGRESAGILAIK